MRILGIDPGIGRMGWGVIDTQGSRLEAVKYGCLETPSTLPVGERLVLIQEFLVKLIKEEKPEAAGVEELFFNTNAKTAFLVGQARGVVLYTLAKNNVPVAIYTPLQVKIAVTGYGRAEKNQIGQMVKTLLHLTSIPKPDDTADALAIALTHSFSSKLPTR